MILNVDPGSYVSLIQGFRHIWFNISWACSSVCSVFSSTSINSKGVFRLNSGVFTIANISPSCGFISNTDTLSACFSSWTFFAACSQYFWILWSRLIWSVFPATGSILSSATFSSSTPLASVTVRMVPSFPFNTSSYFTSSPMIPWLSPPVNPRTLDANVS